MAETSDEELKKKQVEFVNRNCDQLAAAHLSRADFSAAAGRALLFTAAAGGIGFILQGADPLDRHLLSIMFLGLAAALVFLSWDLQKQKSIGRFKELSQGRFYAYLQKRDSNRALDVTAAVFIGLAVIHEVFLKGLNQMNYDQVPSYVALASGILAALFGIRAATVHVRDSLDDFLSDLHRQGRWATYAALTSAIAALSLAAQGFMS